MLEKLRRLAVPGLLLLLTLALVPAAGAESTPEARQWLEKTTQIYERAPFEVDFRLDPGDTAGLDGQAKISGHLLQGKNQRMRADLDLDVQGPQGAMQMALKMVSDGEIRWMEMGLPGLGTQVMKTSVEGDAGGGGPLGGAGSFDLMGQVQKLADDVDFTLQGVESGRVTLGAQLDDQSRAAFEVEGLEQITLILDEKSGFPLEVHLVSEEGQNIKMIFENLKFLDPADVPADAFSYTPPEGAIIQDQTSGGSDG